MTTLTTQTAIATEADLWQRTEAGKHELVDGRIVSMSPAGFDHGRIAVRLIFLLGQAGAFKLGAIVDSSTGFRLPGGNVRSPDVAFVEASRVPATRAKRRGFFDGWPDLAVEILSPDNRPRAVLDKVGEYLEAGVRLVWVIDPEKRTAAVHRSLTDVRQLGETGCLLGEDVLPGFSCALREVLDEEAE